MTQVHPPCMLIDRAPSLRAWLDARGRTRKIIFCKVPRGEPAAISGTAEDLILSERAGGGSYFIAGEGIE